MRDSTTKVIDPTTAKITAALNNAVKEARRIAKMHCTMVWVIKDGKIGGLDP